MAAFWGIFAWSVLFSGELSVSNTLDRAIHARIAMVFVLVGSATLAAVCAIVLRRLARYIDRQVKRLAFSDPLTGLPNRSHLLQQLDLAVQSSEKGSAQVAVLFIDVDRFKVINDSLGHPAGDEALIQVARRFLSRVGPHGVLARFGGDEFVALLENVRDPADAATLAQGLIDCLVKPLSVDGRDLFVTASVGIAFSHARLFRPDDLLRDADLALYRAKAQGRARFALYKSDMNVTAVERLGLETDLWRANERGELKLLYQPEFSIETGELAGFEALIRWNHPIRGLLLPSSFISLAEENGSLNEIGLWVLDSACRQLQNWHSTRGRKPDLEMSVNLSAVQLGQNDFIARVRRILEETQIDPASIRLELTEGIFVQESAAAQSVLLALKSELGMKLAIDDFGTGYSSLSYLKHLPVDVIKIDQSFVTGIERDESNLFIVQGIVTLAHELGMAVTAEGIETEEELQLLREIGCDRGQGFHLAVPLSPDVVAALIRVGIPESQVWAVA